MRSRRKFIQESLTGSLVMLSGSFPLSAFAEDADLTRLTILHTNDVHSRIEPFPMDGSRNQGLGGAVRRAALIDQVRAENENVLLFDSGDIFQGTPYFNFFSGELEIKLMSKMAYDAATIGNHDFDAGIEGLEAQLPHANFPFISSNYDFRNTILNQKTKAFEIFEKDGIKIGVVGVGIELEGLVPQNLYKETRYYDPVSKAEYHANILKNELKCDYVICLSHLGYKYNDQKVSDIHLAQNSKHIDLILGGHTHTFMRKADARRNRDGKEVIISQAGWAGILLGQIEIVFERNKKSKCISCKNTLIQ